MEDKRVIKIGRFTFGLSLIFCGIMITVATFFTLDVLKVVLNLWPILLIVMGCEILFYSRKESVLIKYDVLGMFLTACIIVFSLGFSVINYGINKVFYSKEVTYDILKRCQEKTYSTNINTEKLNIVNDSDTKLKIKVINSAERKSGYFIKISGIYKTNNTAFGIIKAYDETFLSVFSIDRKNGEICINNNINEYKDINIEIEAYDVNSISINGDVVLEK